MWIRRAIAVVLLVVGVVWVLQGVGVLEGSFMTGEIVWAFIGAVCIGVAASLLRPPRPR
jgi:drug/metabolite transporter (DMT)-like permease